jgi:hypothetical protein
MTRKLNPLSSQNHICSGRSVAVLPYVNNSATSGKIWFFERDSVDILGYILPRYNCTFFSLISDSLVNRLTLFLFLRLGKWLIVLPSIDPIHTPVPAVPFLSSPAKAGCI